MILKKILIVSMCIAIFPLVSMEKEIDFNRVLDFKKDYFALTLEHVDLDNNQNAQKFNNDLKMLIDNLKNNQNKKISKCADTMAEVDDIINGIPNNYETQLSDKQIDITVNHLLWMPENQKIAQFLAMKLLEKRQYSSEFDKKGKVNDKKLLNNFLNSTMKDKKQFLILATVCQFIYGNSTLKTKNNYAITEVTKLNKISDMLKYALNNNEFTPTEKRDSYNYLKNCFDFCENEKHKDKFNQNVLKGFKNDIARCRFNPFEEPEKQFEEIKIEEIEEEKKLTFGENNYFKVALSQVGSKNKDLKNINEQLSNFINQSNNKNLQEAFQNRNLSFEIKNLNYILNNNQTDALIDLLLSDTMQNDNFLKNYLVIKLLKKRIFRWFFNKDGDIEKDAKDDFDKFLIKFKNKEDLLIKTCLENLVYDCSDTKDVEITRDELIVIGNKFMLIYLLNNHNFDDDIKELIFNFTTNIFSFCESHEYKDKFDQPCLQAIKNDLESCKFNPFIRPEKEKVVIKIEPKKNDGQPLKSKPNLLSRAYQKFWHSSRSIKLLTFISFGFLSAFGYYMANRYRYGKK